MGDRCHMIITCRESDADRSAGNFGERVSLIARVPDPPTK